MPGSKMSFLPHKYAPAAEGAPCEAPSILALGPGGKGHGKYHGKTHLLLASIYHTMPGHSLKGWSQWPVIPSVFP